MKILLDTSVLVAGALRLHKHHQRASVWLEKLKNGQVQTVVSAHTLAETYSTLTGMPRPYRVSPNAAWQIIERYLLNQIEVIALTKDDYVNLIRQLSQNGIAGGAVYDGVIACAAAKAQVDHIVTFNARDSRRVYPSLAASVIVP